MFKFVDAHDCYRFVYWSRADIEIIRSKPYVIWLKVMFDFKTDDKWHPDNIGLLKWLLNAEKYIDLIYSCQLREFIKPSSRKVFNDFKVWVFSTL